MTKIEQGIPFVYHEPVSGAAFIGRKDVITACYQRLAAPVRTGISIYGGPGIGKSSLLRHLVIIAREEGWGPLIFLYFDCSTIKQFSRTNFWRRVLDDLKCHPHNPISQAQIDRLAQKTTLQAIDFQHYLLRDLKDCGYGLILQLDRFEAIVQAQDTPRSEISSFLSQLRALTGNPEYPLTLITASLRPLTDVCAAVISRDPSPFYNHLFNLPLTPFSPEEMSALLRQAMASTNITFDQADQAFLQRLAGAYPLLLQIAGAQLFSALQTSTHLEQIYETGAENFAREAGPHFAKFWRHALPEEQALLGLILLRYLARQYPFQVKTSIKQFDETLAQYEKTLDALSERGLIYKTRTSYRLFSDLFGAWLLRTLAAESTTILANRYHLLADELLAQACLQLQEIATEFTLNNSTQQLIPRNFQKTAQSIIPDRYELQEQVGSGTYGVVYKAVEHMMKRTVAIKLLHRNSVLSSSAGQGDLLKEAQAAGRLQHPYIVTIYHVDKQSDYVFLVMEYLDGQTLAQFLAAQGKLPLKEVIALVEQAADALDYAHHHGVVHRDIKPANLMITTAGVLKLTDFGIAKMLDDPSLSSSSGTRGTIAYMSPEQMNQQKVQGLTDLFSLAVVAYEMLSGHRPWPGKTIPELVANVSDPNPLSLATFDVPDADRLDPIFKKALAKDPTARYQIGAAFVQALKEAVNPEA